MKFHVDPPQYATETRSTFPIETSISRSTFRTLPVDVQMDYARFYDIPNAEMLLTDDICDALFKGTEWTPALEIDGHVRLVTAKGVIIAKEVMDLVDWLVEHPDDAASPDIITDTPIKTRDQDEADVITRRLSHANLQRIEEELRRAHARIKVAVEESREAVRETCADIFILQSQLETENAYQSGVSEIITNAVGIELMQGIKAQLDVAEREGRLSSDTPPNMAQTQRKRRRNPAPYYVLTDPTRRMGLKRNREDEDLAQNLDSPHIRKRPRLVESSSTSTSSPTNDIVIPRTILNYSSNDEGTDDTYSDSNGTERDFLDDPYSFHDPRGRTPSAELPPMYGREESSEEGSGTDNSQNGVPWSSMADFTDDSSDSEYQPHDWDLEDVWELENTRRLSEWKINPLFQFNFANELRDCDGVMSDGGLSTDDPDEGYHDLGILQRPSARVSLSERRFPQSLGPHLISPMYEHRAYYPPDVDDETIAEMKETAILQAKLAKWYLVKDRLLQHQYPQLDLEQRLADVLGSGHTHFYFDEEEWRCFVEPPLSTCRNTIEITTPEAEA